MLLDVAKPAVVKTGTDVYAQLNRGVLAGGAPPRASTVQPVALEAAATSFDGRHLYVPAVISSDALVVTTPSSVPAGTRTGGGGYASGGSCGVTGVATAGLLTFDVSGNALVDDVASCLTDGSAHPSTLVNAGRMGASVQGLRALATDPTGAFLYLAGFGSNNVAIMPTTSRATDGQLSPPVGLAAGTVSQLVAVGAGPSGIAVTRGGTEAWVFNALDHSLSRLAAQNGRVANVGTFPLASDVLPADVVAGRKLFFGAVDGRMIDPSAGLACASCHLEGREDGHVWNFQEGPRQTPSLAGRMVLQTAPYHWNGEFADLGAFMSLTVQRRMGGTGVTPVMEQQVAAFLGWLPGPDNPHQRSTSAELVARGRAAFDKAQCGTCHAGMPFTNDSFADVGTLVHTGPVVDRSELLPHGGLNTPSLLGLARTAPYLHDGSAASLKARILQGKSTDLHGKTSLLSDTEVDDLVSYLKTL